MNLAQLIATVELAGPESDGAGGRSFSETRIDAVHCRAQEVTPGSLFVAVKGFAADGHDFIPQAVSRGAAAIIAERPIPAEVPVVVARNTRRALAAVAAEFYDHPSRHLTMIGITGTNGKTTTSYLVESILAAAGHRPGVIGTINYRYGGRIFDNPVTTPESLDLQRILADMRAAGITHAVMEVSSHALDLFRVHGCRFDIAVFTNFSQDHLDYHGDMDAYWACKRRLFTDLLRQDPEPARKRAVINTADPKGGELAGWMGAGALRCGPAVDNDMQVSAPRIGLDGIQARIHTPMGGLGIQSPLVGRHNLENILNAAGVGVALEIPLSAIAAGIQGLQNVPGRLERILNPSGRYVYVDYAHTPDALENVLLALRALTADRILCVFGCGGDRDRAKRPKMGAIAARLSDLAVVTSDNPRTEAPEDIIADIVAGIVTTRGLRMVRADALAAFRGKGYAVLADRREAIAAAIGGSRFGDTILIAGKGHEPYQVIGREKRPFDDRLEAKQALEMLK